MMGKNKPNWWCELHDEALSRASADEWKGLREIDPEHTGAVRDLVHLGYLEHKAEVVKKVSQELDNTKIVYRRVARITGTPKITAR
jgi:hypothetical protein